MTETIESSAPGKVVLWGEYAVLAGVPAAVMAVDRFATCRIGDCAEGVHLSAAGFEMSPVTGRSLLDPALNENARLFRAAASALQSEVPTGISIHIDTTAFHDNSLKLGIGSSAAALVACYGALATRVGEEVDLARAIAAHRRFQGSGSGLDIAAALRGGTVRFQAERADPLELPDTLRFRFIFSGESASTGKKLGSFSAWRERGHTFALDMLALACHALFEHADDPHAWRRYVDALRHLDLAAGLGIFSTGHNVLCELADEFGLLYKPCGAGGGDVGMVIGFDHDGSAARIDAFADSSRDRGFTPLDLTGTPHGLECRIG